MDAIGHALAFLLVTFFATMALAATLLVRSWRTGGPAMLRVMCGSLEEGEQGHDHASGAMDPL